MFFSIILSFFFFPFTHFPGAGRRLKRKETIRFLFSSQCLPKAFACKALGITAREWIDRGYKQTMKIQKKRDERGRKSERMTFIRGRKERRNDWTKKENRKVN